MQHLGHLELGPLTSLSAMLCHCGIYPSDTNVHVGHVLTLTMEEEEIFETLIFSSTSTRRIARKDFGAFIEHLLTNIL
jgi:hypothetical protein